MKARHILALAAVTLLLSSCIPSVHPFYSEKDVVPPKPVAPPNIAIPPKPR